MLLMETLKRNNAPKILKLFTYMIVYAIMPFVYAQMNLISVYIYTYTQHSTKIFTESRRIYRL